MAICRSVKVVQAVVIILMFVCRVGDARERLVGRSMGIAYDGQMQHDYAPYDANQMRGLRYRDQEERELHRRRRMRMRRRRRMRNRGRNGQLIVNGGGGGQVYYITGGGGGNRGGGGRVRSRGRGKGKGKGGGSRMGRYYYEDDYYYAPRRNNRRGRRSRFRGATVDVVDIPDGDGIGTGVGIAGGGGGGAPVRVVAIGTVAVRPPYRGTGIGRLNRPRGRPPRARPGGNRFPPGFRASTIRPRTAPPTATPTVQGPTVPPTSSAPSTVGPTTLGPTLAPGTTAAPSTAGPTSAGATPGPTAGGTATQAFVIFSNFGLQYFTDQATDVVADLTTAEYEELRTLMNEFYTTEFQNDPMFATDFLSYDTAITSMVYNAAGNPHVSMDFDANFAFTEGSAITANDILTKMQSLDYTGFITNYLQRAPVNQLDAVQMVDFTASTSPA